MYFVLQVVEWVLHGYFIKDIFTIGTIYRHCMCSGFRKFLSGPIVTISLHRYLK